MMGRGSMLCDSPSVVGAAADALPPPIVKDIPAAARTGTAVLPRFFFEA
jgi:hypothetical protein